MIIRETLTEELKIEFDDETKLLRIFNAGETVNEVCTIEPFSTNMKKFLRSIK